MSSTIAKDDLDAIPYIGTIVKNIKGTIWYQYCINLTTKLDYQAYIRDLSAQAWNCNATS